MCSQPLGCMCMDGALQCFECAAVCKCRQCVSAQFLWIVSVVKRHDRLSLCVLVALQAAHGALTACGCLPARSPEGVSITPALIAIAPTAEAIGDVGVNVNPVGLAVPTAAGRKHM